MKKALEDLESLGAHVEPVTIPCLEYAPQVNIVIIMSEAYSIHLPNVRTQPEKYGENFIKHLYTGGLFSASDYIQAQRARSVIRREFHEVMKGVDLLALPMGHSVVGKLEDFTPGKSLYGPSFMAPFNQTGMPAISVPCGFSKMGCLWECNSRGGSSTTRRCSGRRTRTSSTRGITRTGRFLRTVCDSYFR